jgi:hypothetical protein
MTQRASIVALLTALAAVSVMGSHEAFAQSCVIQNPQRYLLTSDAVDWSIQVASGRSCLRSLRFSNVLLERVSLIAPPKSGNVQLVGPAFRYTAKDGFHGEDSFSIEVLGTSNKVRGTSTIRVAVSVTELKAPASAGPQR